MNDLADVITCRSLKWLSLLILLLLPLKLTYCQQKDYKEARVFITAETTGQLLDDTGFRAFETLEQPDENYPAIIIDDDVTFQEIEGFGGAFTDAAAITFGKLPENVQEQFLKACFDPDEGNGYNLCRTTIHSCDYSDEMYTYAEVEGDKALKHFTIDHDLQYRIPMIKRAMEGSQQHGEKYYY